MTTMGKLIIVTVAATIVEIAMTIGINVETTTMILRANGLEKMTMKSTWSRGPLATAITKRITIKP